MSILYHGGVRGLNAGDIIEGNHDRHEHDDCPLCRMHTADNPADPDRTLHHDYAYCTPIKLYARQYAAICDGDLYQVRPADDCELLPGDEPGIEEYRCHRLIVVRAVERHVQLTWKDRRKLQRWSQRQPGYKLGHDYLPRNATPAMNAKWQQQQIMQAQQLINQYGKEETA